MEIMERFLEIILTQYASRTYDVPNGFSFLNLLFTYLFFCYSLLGKMGMQREYKKVSQWHRWPALVGPHEVDSVLPVLCCVLDWHLGGL